MLDGFIIEEIRRRERQRRDQRDRPVVRLPLHHEPEHSKPDLPSERPPRGVTRVDL